MISSDLPDKEAWRKTTMENIPKKMPYQQRQKTRAWIMKGSKRQTARFNADIDGKDQPYQTAHLVISSHALSSPKQKSM